MEYAIDLAGVNVGFLSGLKHGRLVAEHFPDRGCDSIFDLSCGQPPADPRRRKSSGREVARDVVAVLSPSFPRVTGRKPIAILVDQAPDEGTLFEACIVALGANSVLLKLPLGSLPHRSIHDRLMLTGMAEVLVPDLTHANRIREERVKCPSGERVPARLDSGL